LIGDILQTTNTLMFIILNIALFVLV